MYLATIRVYCAFCAQADTGCTSNRVKSVLAKDCPNGFLLGGHRDLRVTISDVVGPPGTYRCLSTDREKEVLERLGSPLVRRKNEVSLTISLHLLILPAISSLEGLLDVGMGGTSSSSYCHRVCVAQKVQLLLRPNRLTFLIS
jgi:hypothetical protein